MSRIGKETAGQVISFVGLVGVAVTCGVPMWRVTSYIGANIVTGQVVWDGLWMNCVMQSTGQMQCRLNDSVMRLSRDLQAARALVIVALVFGFIGFIVSFVGARCTGCLRGDAAKAKVVIVSGALLLAAAVLVLIPVCWSAAITITDFQSALVIETQKRELGASIYIGWASAAILLVGGIILTTSCPPQKPMYYPGYGPPGYGPPGYGPGYPYAGPPGPPGGPPASYGPVYIPPSTGTGTYTPGKPYAAPSGYSANRFI